MFHSSEDWTISIFKINLGEYRKNVILKKITSHNLYNQLIVKKEK